jgi:putative transposase
VERKNHWGSRLLARIKLSRKPKKKPSPGQKSLWENWDAPLEEIQAITERFLQANALNPEIAIEIARCQVTN